MSTLWVKVRGMWLCIENVNPFGESPRNWHGCGNVKPSVRAREIGMNVGMSSFWLESEKLARLWVCQDLQLESKKLTRM